MRSGVVVGLLRTLLAGAFLVIAFLQVIGLPWLSGVMARDLPAEAYLRWPILTLAVLGLGCVQVGIVCTLRLLGFVRRGEVFSARALRWVDGLTWAFVAASLICLATIVYQSLTVSGPPLWTLLLLCGVALGVGMALLMSVMRALLVQATTLRTELDAVV